MEFESNHKIPQNFLVGSRHRLQIVNWKKYVIRLNLEIQFKFHCWYQWIWNWNGSKAFVEQNRYANARTTSPYKHYIWQNLVVCIMCQCWRNKCVGKNVVNIFISIPIYVWICMYVWIYIIIYVLSFLTI